MFPDRPQAEAPRPAAASAPVGWGSSSPGSGYGCPIQRRLSGRAPACSCPVATVTLAQGLSPSARRRTGPHSARRRVPAPALGGGPRGGSGCRGRGSLVPRAGQWAAPLSFRGVPSLPLSSPPRPAAPGLRSQQRPRGPWWPGWSRPLQSGLSKSGPQTGRWKRSPRWGSRFSVAGWSRGDCRVGVDRERPGGAVRLRAH